MELVNNFEIIQENTLLLKSSCVQNLKFRKLSNFAFVQILAMFQNRPQMLRCMKKNWIISVIASQSCICPDFSHVSEQASDVTLHEKIGLSLLLQIKNRKNL